MAENADPHSDVYKKQTRQSKTETEIKHPKTNLVDNAAAVTLDPKVGEVTMADGYVTMPKEDAFVGYKAISKDPV